MKNYIETVTNWVIVHSYTSYILLLVTYARVIYLYVSILSCDIVNVTNFPEYCNMKFMLQSVIMFISFNEI